MASDEIPAPRYESEYGGTGGLVQPYPHTPTASERFRARIIGSRNDRSVREVLSDQQRGLSGTGPDD